MKEEKNQGDGEKIGEIKMRWRWRREKEKKCKEKCRDKKKVWDYSTYAVYNKRPLR